jgi:hypothetical protein
MKKKNLIATLTLTLVLGVGATAYADSNIADNTTKTPAVCQGSGFRAITGTRGYDFMTNLLKDKFGIAETELTEGRAAGKTMYDIANEKGITPEVFKETMLAEKINSVDDAVNNGSITKEQGEALKARINENSAACTTPGEGQGKRGAGMGNGAGMRGSNRGACGNLVSPSN